MRKRESITLSIGGRHLSGTLSAAERAAPTVVFAHGLGSTRAGEKATALEAQCAAFDWTFASFDFFGHGVSAGRIFDLRASFLIEDLRAMIDFLAARQDRPIFVVGSSMGAWAAAWFAAQHPEKIAACTFIAPAFRFLDPERLRALGQTFGHFLITNQWINLAIGARLADDAQQFSFEKLTKSFKTPHLIFHGMRDDVCPYQDSLDFKERVGIKESQIRLFKEGDHRLSQYKDLIAGEACQFFKRFLNSQPSHQ